MSSITLRLVMLVSAAHALVHVYEVSLPSVEMEVAAEYFPGQVQEGKRMSGWLATAWRLPWGFGAMLAGWLVDRYGARRMLALYLGGCSLLCLLVGLQLPLPMLFVSMFAMGTLASIYHPAGLGLISHATTLDTRPRALGIHGIFGSAGIALAPLLIGLLQAQGLDWRTYYWLLSLPGMALALFLVVFLGADRRQPGQRSLTAPRQAGDWRSFFVLTGLALLQGLVYSGVISFLPRYIRGAGLSVGWLPRLSTVSMVTSFVLLLGCIGQYLAGYLTNPRKLERQLTFVTLANAPLLVGMSLAAGWWRAVAAGVFAIVHFMHQPLYNCLIAKYTPAHRRSLCYGFSFAMGLGLGAFGASFVGNTVSDAWAYSALAGVSGTAALLAATLWRWDNKKPLAVGPAAAQAEVGQSDPTATDQAR